MQGQVVGSLIAAVFGAVYVAVNTGSMPPGAQWPLRAIAGVAICAVLVGASRRLAARQPAAGRSDGPVFQRAFWLAVCLEAVLIFGGVRVLAGPLGTPEAGVAWVSVVVGVHFFALARIFDQTFFNLLGAAIGLCGVAALLLAFTGAGLPSIDLVGGVAPGLLLLASALWGVQRRPLAHGMPDTPSIAGQIGH